MDWWTWWQFLPFSNMLHFCGFLHLPSCFFRHPTQNLYLITEYPNENFTSTWLIQCFDKNQNLLVHNESSQGHGQKRIVPIALLIKYFCFCGMTLWSWVSCLAIIFFVRNESSWAHVKTKKFGVKTFDCSHCDKKFGLLLWQKFLKFALRHKKYGAKTFNCSHCDKKFGLLLWQEFLKFEDM